MPIYMDRHFIEGATHHAIAQAHDQDLALQGKYDIKFLTYWFDEARSTAFCLAEAPDKATLQAIHNEAHGNVSHEIIEVNPAIVEAFLGRVKDPTPVDTGAAAAHETPIDAAFRAIMFTDLKDSTLMTSTFGDARGLHLLHVHNALTRNALRDHRGREVKHTGDGIMASFAAVDDAVDCAITIQRGFADHNRAHPAEAMHLRIGLSAGEPIEEDGDLFGNAVQLAARLCAHAEPGRILVADVVRDQCADRAPAFTDMGEVTPKGFTYPIHVYEVNWA